jgi:serine/threonine protein phosphatase PrpC
MGPYLSSPIREKKTQHGENHRVKFATCEMQGWRNSMEDAKIANISLDAETMLFGVFDGHGGKEVAEYVSRHFCAELLRSPAYRQGNFEQALKDTFLRMDDLLKTPDGLKEVIRISKDLPDNYPVEADSSLMVAGCTAVVALIRGETIYVANAGDSRCILSREGRAIELSQDHKPELPGEHDRIIKAGGMVEDGRVMGNLNLSRSIGDLEYKKTPGIPQKDQMITAYPEIKIDQLTARDEFIVLACDGVWDMLTSQECVNFIGQRLKSKSLQIIAEETLDRCLAHDIASSGGLGCDNTTIVIVELKH